MASEKVSDGRIRIAFILGTLDIGGTEQQFLETVRRLDPRRFDCHVLAFGNPGRLRNELKNIAIPVTMIPCPRSLGKFDPRFYWQLFTFLRSMTSSLRLEQPHIVQSYLLWANIYGSIAAKLAGVPVIITGRRATLDEQSMRVPKFPHQWLQNLTNTWVSAVITNSQIVKEQALHRESYLKSHLVEVIPNGVCLEKYPVVRKQMALPYPLPIPERTQRVGIVASLHPRKGHRDLLRAAALVLQHYPDTMFILVGRDEGIQSELETLADTLNIREAVLFTGERDDIPELLSMLDVQVSSSFTEGLSNAILEGMALGNPIVATTAGGNPELVIHEQTGLLVPPGKPAKLAHAIMQLLDNPSLRRKMGRAGRQRVEQFFRMEKMIEQTEMLYQNLCQNSHIK